MVTCGNMVIRFFLLLSFIPYPAFVLFQVFLVLQLAHRLVDELVLGAALILAPHAITLQQLASPLHMRPISSYIVIHH